MTLLILILCLVASVANATVYHAASTSQTDIQAAVYSTTGSADIVILPPGSNIISSQIIITNGCSIVAARNTVILTNTQPILGGQQYPIFNYEAQSDRNCVIQGAILLNDGVNNNCGILSGFGGNTVHATKLRITDCTISGFHFGVMIQSTFGVCDHCYFLQNFINSRVPGYLNSSYLFQIPAPPWAWDSTNSWVYESDTVIYTNQMVDTYEADTQYPAPYTVRFCNFGINKSAVVGMDGFDMHGMDNPSEVYPIAFQIYGNWFTNTGNTTVNPMNIAAQRGGANGLVYSNTVVGIKGNVNWLNNPNAGPLLTNSFMWENYGNGGATPASYSIGTDPVTLGVNFFTNKPSNFAALVFPHPQSTPYISGPVGNQSVTAPATATFTVVATVGGGPSYQWYSNEVAIAGATSSTYTTPPTTVGFSGSYYFCVVTDNNGSVHSTDATLTVIAGGNDPAITVQPSNQSVTAPATAAFSVTATGTAPLTYQWYKNGVLIVGATSAAYTTPPTAGADNGALFHCIVSGPGPNSPVTSSDATLIVHVNPSRIARVTNLHVGKAKVGP